MDDTIYRQAAIDALTEYGNGRAVYISVEEAFRRIEQLPSAQPEIIRCKDCMHNGSYDTDCPIDWNGKEYCSFAERRTDERQEHTMEEFMYGQDMGNPEDGSL